MSGVQQPRPPEYRLITRWVLPADPERVWSTLADPLTTWPQWWPGLRADGDGFVLRPARWAYALRFTVTLVAEDPPRTARVAVTGDLVGTGLVELRPTPAGSTLELDWRVRTTRPWMIRTAPLLAPVFRRAHAHAMNRGYSALSRLLTA